MLAPLLYMLALAGIGAAVMFSGYSQILRSNAEMTAVNTTRAQLQSAVQTLSAASQLDAATSTIVQPPAVLAFNDATVTAQSTRLPANYLTVGNTGSPTSAGAIDPATGVKQLDPWGKFYVYCRWENDMQPAHLSSPAIMVISAGPDGSLSTKCGDTAAVGDDRIVTSTIAETINRANVWQVASSSQVKFGLASNPVAVNSDGSMSAASLTTSGNASVGGTLTVTGATTLNSTLSAGATTLSSATIGPLTAGATTLSGLLTANAGVTTTTLGTSGAATLASAGITGNATVGGTLGVTGNTTLSGTLSAGATGLANTGITGTLGVSGAVTLSSTLSAGATTLSSLSLTTPLGIASGGTGANTAAGARTALGLGTMATQNANAVAITGGTISGVDMTGSTGGTAGSVAASNVTGCCVALSAGGTGVNASSAANLRNQLGIDNASNLLTGTLGAGLLPSSGVTPGTYNLVTVDTYGRVTVGANQTASQWTTTGSDIYYTTGNVAIGTATANSKLTVYNASSATLTNFTQAIASAGINVATNFTANNYTPGLFWSTTDNNATKPKGGIYLLEGATGSTMVLGTSNAYATGITN